MKDIPMLFAAVMLAAAVVGAEAARDNPSTTVQQAERTAAEKAGEAHLNELRAAGMLPASMGMVRLKNARMVEPEVSYHWGKARMPMWWADLEETAGPAGFIAWESTGNHALTDFCVEGMTALVTAKARAIDGVPAIQEFPINSPDAVSPIASGCVPTAAASLVAFWSNRGIPGWQGNDDYETLTLRIRRHLKTGTIPDVQGFTDGKMALSTADPMSLVTGLKEDAKARQAFVEIESPKFDYSKLVAEIDAGRPVIVACKVPLPQKPQFTWGHAVVAVGYAEVAGKQFVGVIDNFLPLKKPGSIRWITKTSFQYIMITVGKK